MTMSLLDWSFLDPLGRAIIAAIEPVISLSAITSVLSLSAALVATWVMQVTTHQAGLKTPGARLALAQRTALAALAIFLMLNAVTPFITPDPPWLANLPLVIAIIAFLLGVRLVAGACREGSRPLATMKGGYRDIVASSTLARICALNYHAM
jgi:hypothetical protein